MATIEETFIRLNKSTFRVRFHLSEKDKKYVNEKGIDVIRQHSVRLRKGANVHIGCGLSSLS